MLDENTLFGEAVADAPSVGDTVEVTYDSLPAETGTAYKEEGMDDVFVSTGTYQLTFVDGSVSITAYFDNEHGLSDTVEEHLTIKVL